MTEKLNGTFFRQDALIVAEQLIGNRLVRQFDSGEIRKYRITETEAYRGENDLACHASKGLTNRTRVMYEPGGKVYVYLIYGIYWMLNFTTNETNFPAAVLIRGLEEISGPGRIGRELRLDKSFYAENLESSKRIWVESDSVPVKKDTSKRIGIDYAGEWKHKLWRFQMVV